MKIRFLFIILILVLTFSLAGGCGKSNNQQTINALKLVPRDAYNIAWINWETLRTDSTLDDILNGFKDELGVEEIETFTGVSYMDMELMVIAEGDNSYWMIIKGDLDMESIHSSFENQNMTQDEYKGMETWYGEPSAAFINGMLIFADNIEETIDSYQNGGNSIYDDKDSRDILTRMPAAIFSFFSSNSDSDALINAVAVSAQSVDSLALTGYYLFSSEDIAQENISIIQDEMENGLGGSMLEINRDGKLVEMKGKINIADFIEGDFFGDIFG